MMFDKENSIEAAEAELEQVLQNFRGSVHAWSESEYGRSRSVASTSARHTWRLAAGWALGCALVVGGLSTGLYERHHQNEQAKSTAARRKETAATIESAPATAVKTAVETPVEQVARLDANEPDATLLAAVDSDVSRQVPSAMEPLAQLMENSGQ